MQQFWLNICCQDTSAYRCGEALIRLRIRTNSTGWVSFPVIVSSCAWYQRVIVNDQNAEFLQDSPQGVSSCVLLCRDWWNRSQADRQSGFYAFLHAGNVDSNFEPRLFHRSWHTDRGTVAAVADFQRKIRVAINPYFGLRLALFRVVQEALTNIQRHAGIVANATRSWPVRAGPSRCFFVLRPASARAVRRGAAAPPRSAFDFQYRCLSRTTLQCVLPNCAAVHHVPRTSGTSRRLRGGVLFARKASHLSLTRARLLALSSGRRDEASFAKPSPRNSSKPSPI